MQIQINGKQIDIGDALRTHVDERLNAAVGKYADRAVDAVVTFSREAHTFKADAQVHLPTGLVTKAKGSATEIYAAFENCVERIEKQLRRYKRRLKDHHAARHDPIEATEAAAYVISSSRDENDAVEPDTLDPLIIAEMKMDISTISVGEAVMQMELADAPFLVFRNQRHGGVNVVFRRDDGNIGWVDPEILTAQSA
jgi:ribosomal subunit interface protein